MKKDLNFASITASFKRIGRVIGKRFYFFYIVFLLLGLGIVIALIFFTFSEEDLQYKEDRQSSILQDVQLKKDEATVDHVLQLETAGAGKIRPNYDPNRDNPFSE